jgi:glucose-6-phosphate isomerase
MEKIRKHNGDVMNSERTLEFGGEDVNPDIRRLQDVRDVIYDKNWFRDHPDFDLYYMYRDLALTREDKISIRNQGLRYDITIIPPKKLGEEFVKTAGHYHPLIEGTHYSYPEVYEVLEGTAHYLLQKREKDRIVDFIIIEATAGDKVIVPPNYGHVTINHSDKELKMANWVSRNFESIYDPYKKCGGAAYFELTNGKIIQNKNYNQIPEIRYLKPMDIPEIGLYKRENMYGLIKEPKKLSYFNHPQDYDWLCDDSIKLKAK